VQKDAENPAGDGDKGLTDRKTLRIWPGIVTTNLARRLKLGVLSPERPGVMHDDEEGGLQNKAVSVLLPGNDREGQRNRRRNSLARHCRSLE
jgi:hypothetical protein